MFQFESNINLRFSSHIITFMFPGFFFWYLLCDGEFSMEDFVVRSLSSLWFYFISCSKLIFPVLWAVTNITSGSVKEIQKCHFTFLISLVVWIHATAFGAWWHRFVSYGAVVCFLGKTQELSFLEKKKKNRR